MGFGTVLALLLESRLTGRARGFYRNVYFIPSLISLTAVGLMFNFVYSPQVGLLNTFLKNAGLSQFQQVWLGDKSICIFMEMEWINSSSIHTGEFFHGPFEITDAQSPFMIQISEGPTRELDERALTFLRKYARRLEVLDAKDLGLSTIDASVVSYFNHSLFNNVYDVYNHALADLRQHPLSTRRNMWKVEY